jgi:hypothetical protein
MEPWEVGLSGFSNLRILQREMEPWEVGLSGFSNLRILQREMDPWEAGLSGLWNLRILEREAGLSGFWNLKILESEAGLWEATLWYCRLVCQPCCLRMLLELILSKHIMLRYHNIVKEEILSQLQNRTYTRRAAVLQARAILS